MTRSSNCIIIQVILSFNRPIIPKCHICLSPIFLFEAQSSGLNKICSKHWTLETRTPYTFLASPVARDHFFFGGGGGGGGGTGIWVNQWGKWGRREWWEEGKKSDTWSRRLSSFSPFLSHHPPFVLCARSHHPKLAHHARLQHPALKVCALH